MTEHMEGRGVIRFMGQHELVLDADFDWDEAGRTAAVSGVGRMKMLFKALGLSGAAIALLFSVYYFNLDMKLVRFVVVPLLDKHYDSVQREHVL